MYVCVSCLEKEAFHLFACCSDCCIDLLSLNEGKSKPNTDLERRIALCVGHVQIHNVERSLCEDNTIVFETIWAFCLND